jgi:hypothetical protein
MISNNGHEKMRVLFLSDHLGYADGVTHGATTYFTNVLPHLASNEVELTVCFLRERHASATHLEAMGVTPLFLHRSKWDPRALSLHAESERAMSIRRCARVSSIASACWSRR